jgi:signal transduction histidine kinase
VRLALKLTLALATTAGLTFGTYASFRLDEESHDLEDLARREVSLLARSLQVALENALRDGQLEDVDETISRLDLVDRDLEVYLFDDHGVARANTRAEPPGEPHRALVARAEASGRLELMFDAPTARGVLLAAVPLSGDDGRRLGTVVVDRPLAALRAELAETRRSYALAVVAAALAAGAVVFTFASLGIARPLARLGAGMRRIEAGDLETPLAAGSPDEIGELTAAFNHMLHQLREARATLEAGAEARRELLRALEAANRLAAIGQLSAGLAHEIGSPLQVLIGRARALAERPGDPAEATRQATIIAEQGERITRIVEQLLRLARRRPTAAPATGPVDLARACRAVIELVEVEARRRGVALQLVVRTGVTAASASEDHLQQVVLNLATNALAATPAGGRVEVAIEDAEGRPELIRLVVTDTGRGIEPDVLPRVFEPMFTTRVDDGGTGLGLAVVRALVTEHGGTVTADSAPGRGARFVVELPRAAGGGA